MLVLSSENDANTYQEHHNPHVSFAPFFSYLFADLFRALEKKYPAT